MPGLVTHSETYYLIGFEGLTGKLSLVRQGARVSIVHGVFVSQAQSVYVANRMTYTLGRVPKALCKPSRSRPFFEHGGAGRNVMIGLDVTGENCDRGFKMRGVVQCANFDNH